MKKLLFCLCAMAMYLATFAQKGESRVGINLNASLGDGRGPDIANANTLKINGTVTFVYYTLDD